MKTIYFDCFCGASGDMIVGALLDLGVEIDALRQSLASLDVHGFALRAEKVKKKGVMATQFHVDCDPSVKQPHRHLHHVVDIINAGDLPDSVKGSAIETFERIAVAEAAVHGTTVEKIHFHEVGAIDSIVDVVGAHFGLHALGIERVCASALHVGAGTVKCAHGVMPVPAPATALLLEGVPSYGGDVPYELVTPTGAALLAHRASSFGPMPLMRTERIGYGSGMRDLEDRPNVLRALIGETAVQMAKTEQIAVVETNLDDMTPELVACLTHELLYAGARDAFVVPILAKKGRPGHLVTALCEVEKQGDIARVFFAHSATFGVRMRVEDRFCLEREWQPVTTPWGEVRVKLGRLDGAIVQRTPEFEDCRQISETAGVPVRMVYERALAAAGDQEVNDG